MPEYCRATLDRRLLTGETKESVLGPSRENLAHTVDEYVELTQLFGAVECYYAVMEAMLL